MIVRHLGAKQLDDALGHLIWRGISIDAKLRGLIASKPLVEARLECLSIAP